MSGLDLKPIELAFQLGVAGSPVVAERRLDLKPIELAFQHDALGELIAQGAGLDLKPIELAFQHLMHLGAAGARSGLDLKPIELAFQQYSGFLFCFQRTGGSCASPLVFSRRRSLFRQTHYHFSP